MKQRILERQLAQLDDYDYGDETTDFEDELSDASDVEYGYEEEPVNNNTEYVYMSKDNEPDTRKMPKFAEYVPLYSNYRKSGDAVSHAVAKAI